MTKFPDLFAALAAPFEPHEVKVRQAPGGRQIAYITARTAMNRLDTVLGPESWWDTYIPSANSVMCQLAIRLPDGSVVIKTDAGGYAGMSDSGDDDKSGYSDAFKRAAAKFGVARYLYRDGVPAFVQEINGEASVPEKPNENARREPPRQERAQGQRRDDRRDDRDHGDGQGSKVPRSGRALFAWIKDQEQRHEVGILKYMNQWGKLHEFPGRIVDWDNDQVAQAYAEACRKIQALAPPDRGDAHEPPVRGDDIPY